MWILKTVEGLGEAEALTFRLSTGAIRTIGRSTGADFIIDAPLVSRLHCQLTAGDDALEVKDLDSTNGTYVEGARVREGRLASGGRLKVGRVELVAERQA